MIYVLATILAIIFIYSFSWITTCGIIKLITLCFGLTFTWPIATGIWLILFLLSSFFRIRVSNNNSKK